MAINGGTGLTIDAASALEINSSGGTISVGNDAVAQNIEIGNSAAARSIIIGDVTDPSLTTEIELNAVLVDINTGLGGLDIDASGTVDIAVAAAPAATDGSSINLTAGAGTGSGNRAGGNIILTPGAKANAGTDGFVAINGPTSSTAGLYLSPNAAAANDRWKITAAADGASLTMSSLEGGAETARLIIGEDGTVTSPGGFAGDMASDELISETPMVIGSNYTSTNLPTDPAVEINAATGGISIDAGKASNITTATGDLTIGGATQTNAIIIQSAEAASDAVHINASAGGFSIEGAAASSVTTSAGNLALTADAVDAAVVIKGDHISDIAVHIDANENAASIVKIDAGVFNVESSGATTILAQAASSITTGAGAITVNGATGVDLQYGAVSVAKLTDNATMTFKENEPVTITCLLYTSPSPRD